MFVYQLFMWYLLVSSHGVFVSISNGGGSSIKTLLLIVCNSLLSDFKSVVRGFEKGKGYKKRTPIRGILIFYILCPIFPSLNLSRRQFFLISPSSNCTVMFLHPKSSITVAFKPQFIVFVFPT